VGLNRRAAERRVPGAAGALLLLAFVYLLSLVVQMPMRVLVGLFPLPPEVRLDVGGDSAWSGTVTSVLVAGKDLGSLDYVINPWRALLGEMQYSVVLDTGAGRIDAVVNRSLWTGIVNLRNVRGEVNAALFQDVLSAPAATRGQLLVAFDSIALRHGEYFHAEGRAEWRNLVVELGEGIRFGSVDFAARPENEGTLVELASRDGEVLAAGTVFIDPEGGFESRIELREGDALTAAGRGLLNLADAVDDDGILKHAWTLF
jgi:hypothetical protein